MALNPPIEALPIQQADRDGHLQRFLTSLPTFGSWQDREGPTHSEIQVERDGMEVIQDRGVEAAERRNERKLRRREKAAINKPKPPPALPDPPVSQEELDQEWWDRYRAQKQGLNIPGPNPDDRDRDEEMEMEMEKAELIIERKENRRQQRIPKAKGRKERGGVPGLDIVNSYRPMTTALGPRMTMKPEQTKKGMFANGKSSNVGIIELLESTKANNARVSSSQATSVRRLTMESPDQKQKGDWKDQWRRKSSQQHPTSQPRPQPEIRLDEMNGRLPPPGYTNSTSWPSTLPSSDGPSRASRNRQAGEDVVRREIPDQSSHRSLGHGQGDMLARYMYRHPSLQPLGADGGPSEFMPGPPEPMYHHQPPHPYPHQDSHPHHLQHSRSIPEDHNIYINQRNTHIGDRESTTHQPSNQFVQYHNPYPQAYSPPSHSHPHSYPYPPFQANPHFNPYIHAHANGDLPQTPRLQEPRGIRYIDPEPERQITQVPFSTPGPSRLPPNGEYQAQTQIPSYQAYFSPAAFHGYDRAELVDEEMPEEDGLEGFWISDRHPIDLVEDPNHPRPLIDVERQGPPVFPQYNYQSGNYRTPEYRHLHPSSYDITSSIHPHAHTSRPGPESRYQPDPTGQYWKYQHQLDRNQNTQDNVHKHALPAQAYMTPRIQNAIPHLGYMEQTQTQLPIPPNHIRTDHLGSEALLRELEDREENEVGNQGEMSEYGASKDEWKSFWSSRKAVQ